MNELLPALPGLMKDVLSGMRYFLPEITLILVFVLVILADLFFPGKRSSAAFWLCLSGIAVSVLLTFIRPADGGQHVYLFGNTLINDGLSRVFKQLFGGVLLLYAVFIRCNPQIQGHRKGAGDLYMLLPAALLGLHLMAMSASLLMVYISVEMVSIASYLMVGYLAGDHKQTEAAMKYVLFGAACSAVMLYGMSLLYAFTGTLTINAPEFIGRLSEMPATVSMVAIVMVLVGIGFKLSFVPLHFWSPDIYEGAPVPVTAFLSTGPKIAGFAVLIRFLTPFYSSGTGQAVLVMDFEGLLSAVAVLSMIIGNFVAVWQNNVKRMLAYSSIGHTGFVLMAVVVHSSDAYKAILFYLLIYAVMNMAAFMLAGRIEDRTGAVSVKDYKGLGRFLKPEMVCFVVVLISLTGLPPLAGFIGKFLVFSVGINHYSSTGSGWMLAMLITGAVTTVVSLFYYLKIPLYAFLRQTDRVPVLNPSRDILIWIIGGLTFLLLLWGIFPSLVL